MDVLTATSGGAATVAYHQSWDFKNQLAAGAQFVGWDPGGPVATWPSILGTQGGGPHHWNGSRLVHFPGGRPGSPLPAPNGCDPMDLLATGVFVCGRGNQAIQVIGPDGNVRWRYTGAELDVVLLYGFLSPDMQHVVATGRSSPTVFSPSGAPVVLPDAFFHAGWIDSQTIAGIVGRSQDFAYLTLSNPNHVVDLGFKGQFVGGLVR